MSAVLVTLPQVEVKWSRPGTTILVGKDILELLTTSMYVDPMSMYREYIQNSADAIDVARSTGSLRGAGRVEIRIDQASRSVVIRDNGAGLAKEHFAPQLMAFGGSKKRGTNARGFRGVGRLAGLAFCQELIFRSRQDGENTVHELRWDSREVRSLLRSADASTDLRDVVSSTIQTREVSGRGWPARFFEVELRGVIRHKNDQLLDQENVSNYLAQVAPVPFSRDFSFGEEIRAFLGKHGVHIGEIELEVVGFGRVFRPHRDSVAIGKAFETRFLELTTIDTPGRDGGIAAVTWILHHDYRGALPSNSFVEGWRLRCGDIQVGDNSLLQPCFPESRFNAWCVAETHVLDPRILPNGRRDHFEQSSFYFDLVNHLTPHARGVAQRCRTSSIARNLVQQIEEKIAESQRNLSAIEKALIGDRSAAKLSKKLDSTLVNVERLSSRSSLSTDQQSKYRGQISRLRNRVLRLPATRRSSTLLKGFSPGQRTILTEVFNVIYHGTDDLHIAQKLVEQVISRLSRESNPRMNKKRRVA